MFYQNLLALCGQRSTSPTRVVRELGISGGSVTNWKSGAVPHDATLRKIADYFGVTVDELLGSEKKDQAVPPVPDLTPEEMLLLQQWRNHPEAQPFVRKLLDMPEPTAEDGAVS
ncbi:MAG: helix-turn-helix transcriptional regulator [Ruminococcaceae bacterium]|nr:helix-turn-helix transcriptional regulator [Oscillospiraceae bacterium]